VKRILLTAVCLLLGSTLAEPAIAVAQAKPEVQYFDNWEVRCFPIKSTTPCDMLFATVRKGTGARIASVSIAYAPSQNHYVMQIAVPYGIALPDGLVIAAGSFKSAKLPFRRCDRMGCYVEMAVGEDLINALKVSNDGTLNVVADRGKPVSLGISLKGFGTAHDAMVSSANDKAVTAQPAGSGK
jgi:invasion protein IalB